MDSGHTNDPQTWNRYIYVYNNPLTFTDPTGMFGDFYSLDGKHLGTDGKNDGRFYVVTDKSQASTIAQTDKKGGTTDVSNVNSAVGIGSVAVRDGIGDAVAASNSPTTDDKKGGFHEEGLMFGTTASGSQIPIPSVPGAYSDVTIEGGTATVDPTHAANPSLAANLVSIDGTAHIHPPGVGKTTTDKAEPTPLGTTTIGGPPIKQHTPVFNQPASNVDKAAFPIYAQQGYGNTHIVVGARSKEVEIYQVQNGASVLRATMKLNTFLHIGKK